MKTFMKFLSFGLFLPFLSFSSEPIVTPSEITAATVYTKGAMISRSVTIEKLGKQTILLKGLPLNIHQNSLVLDADASIDIISINSYKRVDLEDAFLEIDELAPSSESLRLRIDKITELISVLNTEETIITQLDCSSEDKKLSIDEVIKASAFYRTRLKEIKLEIFDLKNERKSLNLELAKIQQAIDKFNQRKQEYETQIEIKLTANSIIENGIKIHYYIPDAYWTPFYDIKIKEKDADLKLYRKAYVFQQTGHDWTKIKLSLSNADPLASTHLPTLSRHNILGPRNPAHNMTYNKSYHSGYEGIVLNQEGEPVIGASILLNNSTVGTVTGIDGRFVLPHHVQGGLITVSYIGFKDMRHHLYKGMNIIVLKEEAALLDEIVVTGSRSKVSAYYIDGVRVSKEHKAERQALQMLKSEAINSVEYQLTQPFTIISGKEKTDVLLEVNNLPYNLEHVALPSKSQNTYLLAKIPDWHKLDLLNGMANIFLSNSYKGETLINSKTTIDTLDISLGIDPEVIIEKEQLKDHYSKRFFSNKVEEKLAYEIVVKNNKSRSIRLTILDQIPVSDNKDVTIDLEDKSQAKLDKEKGFLKWTYEINSGNTINCGYRYKIKYPKSYSIIL